MEKVEVEEEELNRFLNHDLGISERERGGNELNT
jgi:hypothetical protein